LVPRERPAAPSSGGIPPGVLGLANEPFQVVMAIPVGVYSLRRSL